MRYSRSQAQGFTLIEILVVLFIISIVTTVALLSIGRSDNKQMESFANELTQSLTLAEEQAMLQPTVLGFTLNQQGFHFASLKTTGQDKKETWVPLTDSLLGKHAVPKNIEVTIKVGSASQAENEEEASARPNVIISTNGDITPFSIYVGKKGQHPRYVIIGDADGNVRSQALS